MRYHTKEISFFNIICMVLTQIHDRWSLFIRFFLSRTFLSIIISFGHFAAYSSFFAICASTLTYAVVLLTYPASRLLQCTLRGRQRQLVKYRNACTLVCTSTTDNDLRKYYTRLSTVYLPAVSEHIRVLLPTYPSSQPLLQFFSTGGPQFNLYR
jgi:hypothetical protein